MNTEDKEPRGTLSTATAQHSKGPLDSTFEDRSSTQSLAKDVAAGIVPDYALQIDRTLERRVVRKIDLFLIPFMWIGYGLVYYDKVTIAAPPPLFF